MPIRPKIDIKTDLRSAPTLPNKRILRAPCYSGESESELKLFPQIDHIRTRYASSSLYDLLLDDFFYAVSQALHRVLIIDPYFFKPHLDEDIEDRIEHLQTYMDNRSFQAPEVKIISGCDEGKGKQLRIQSLLQQVEESINQGGRNQQPGLHPLSIKFKLFPERMIHDRFAIIDEELWHFGGTVGGFEKQLSVASRGWLASEYGADTLFYNLWRISV